jgi:hypothetical protein
MRMGVSDESSGHETLRAFRVPRGKNCRSSSHHAEKPKAQFKDLDPVRRLREMRMAQQTLSEFTAR